MSLANIIMQGTAQGLESRSRGIRSLAKGIEKAGDWYQGKEERETKKRYMNAQADAMETSAKAGKKKLSDQNALQTIISEGQKAGKTTAEIAEDARVQGIGDLGSQWYDQTLINEKNELAAESQKWTIAEQKADEIGMLSMGANTEEEMQGVVQKINQMTGKDITEGHKGSLMDLKAQLENGSKKVQDVMYKKQQMVMQRGANEVDRLDKIIKDLEAKPNKTDDDKKYLERVKANRETSVQKVQATISLKEENERMKLEKRKGAYAKTGTEIIQSLWSDDELGDVTGSEAAMRGETKAIAYATELLESGVPISEVKRWAADNVSLDDQNDWADPTTWWKEDAVTFTKYQGEVPKQGASPGDPAQKGALPQGWDQAQYDTTAQAIAKGEGISLEDAKKALDQKLGVTR